MISTKHHYCWIIVIRTQTSKRTHTNKKGAQKRHYYLLCIVSQPHWHAKVIVVDMRNWFISEALQSNITHHTQWRNVGYDLATQTCMMAFIHYNLHHHHTPPYKTLLSTLRHRSHHRWAHYLKCPPLAPQPHLHPGFHLLYVKHFHIASGGY